MSREPRDHGADVDLHGNTSATPGHADSAGGGTGELQTAALSGERDTDVQEDESHQEGTSTPHAGDDGSEEANVIITCTTATDAEEKRGTSRRKLTPSTKTYPLRSRRKRAQDELNRGGE